jgi:hypothetical protein
MSVLLFVVGAIVAMLGVGMVGYGIPINEFSFGNTLIVAGTTAAVGGLIVIAIGAAVGQLQRIAEMLATRTPVRSSRPFEMFEPPAGSRAPIPNRIPFPPKPKSEAAVREPQASMDATVAADTAVEAPPAAQVAPMLRNPDMPVAVVEEFEIKEYENVSLSPQQPMPAPAPLELSEPAAQMQERPSQTSYFDAMWPAESKPVKRTVIDEAQPEPPPPVAAPEPPVPDPVAEPPVAILKSGVVDGMGYTLYVDGSIEAELPQGTLRFASINDLRGHLAKNS